MSISHRARRAWMSACLVPSGDFLKLEKRSILRSNTPASNAVSNWGGGGGDVYGAMAHVEKGLWRGLFEPYEMSRVVSAIQIGGRTTIEDDPKSGTALHVVYCTKWHTLGLPSRDDRPRLPSWDITMYLVLSALTSNPISLVAATRASAFSFVGKCRKG
jgi:hypothetical protein